jgi:tRNA (guanine37-N1)-methyltransferase
LAGFDAGKLPRADRTALGDLGYDVVDGRLRLRPAAGGEGTAGQA